MTQDIPRSATELPKLLADHLDMLVSLCGLYDSGKMNAAPSIAANLRVLLHQTPKSDALLFQLRPQTIEFFDTDKASIGGDPGSFCSNAGMAFTFGLQLGNQFIESWSPTLNMFDVRSFPTRFAEWWHDKSIVFGPTSFSRFDLVMALANKDGGSHVSKTLKRPYFDLTRVNDTGVVMSVTQGQVDSAAISNAAFEAFSKEGSGHQAARAVVRQVAHEVLETLLDNRKYYLKQCEESFKPSERDVRMLVIFKYPHMEPRREHWKSPAK